MYYFVNIIIFANKKMCYKTICKHCGKYTWSGCGRHIERALKGVPQSKRCTCHR